MASHSRLGSGLVLLLAAAIVAIPLQQALALIIGGVGNSPLRDPGWPEGAAVIFNTPARVAYWEGPPFGGGQWHAECRGDAKAFNAVLADFAKLDVKSKRLVIHDGPGKSFWLNTNDEPAKRAQAKMDWSFMVWQPDNWKRLRKLPADLNPTNPNDAENGPPSQIDVYTGGNIKWTDVVVPKGITIDDRRLEARGYTLADGIVLEGKVTDLATKKPVSAMMRLELIDPQRDAKGGYRYKNVAGAVSGAGGHWVLKKAPEGWHRVVIEAPGYVPRVAGHAKFDDQPKWQSFDVALARAALVTGRIIDDEGQPLADVEVRIANVAVEGGGRYESPLGYTVKTGKDGRFKAEQVPVGKATIWVHKPGYIRPGLGQPIAMPQHDVELKMTKSASLEVTIDFGDKVRPQGYIVHIAPEGGEKIGSYGGSGNINAKNQMTFDNVPPGRYVFSGQPNPGSANQKTDPVTIELKGGQSAKVTLKAK